MLKFLFRCGEVEWEVTVDFSRRSLDRWHIVSAISYISVRARGRAQKKIIEVAPSYRRTGRASLTHSRRRTLATNFTFKSAYLARSHYLSAIKNLEGRRRSATPRRTLSCPTTVYRFSSLSSSSSSAFSHFCIYRSESGRRREDPDCSGGLAPAPRVHHRQRRAVNSRLPTARSSLLTPCVHATRSLPLLFPPLSLFLSLFLSLSLGLGLRPPAALSPLSLLAARSPSRSRAAHLA